MAESAFQTQYRQEMIATFEVGVSLAYQSTTHEAVVSGNTATFLVAGSGGATAVTRGVNGQIPGRPNDLTQVSCTLAEWHDLPQITGFNICASQGNIRTLMQRTTMEVINRKLDDLIITELNTATNNVNSTGEAASIDMIAHAKTILGTNKVPFDQQITSLITPAFEAYLEQIPEYASADYVNLRALDGNNGNEFANSMKARNWMGVNWIVHPELPGVGTASEKCFMYHKSAIGCAMDTEGMKCPVGYEEEQDYSWSRCTAYTGSKLLQNSGVVVMTHDGSGYAAV
mgnify:CR=1 FL=1